MALDTRINDTNKNEVKPNIIGFFKRHFILTGFLIAIIAITGWWKYEFISGSWRYKMTVTIETPQGIKSGSSVYELSNSDMRHRIGGLPEGRNPAELKGEAVAVDLGDRGILFALIPDDLFFYNVFPVPNGFPTRYEGIKYYINLKSAQKTLEKSQYPTFVTFGDIKDPKTVVAVDRENLAATFGEGIKLIDVTIEMTDEDVTWEISKHLVWLDSLNGGYLHGGFTSRDSPMGLYGGNFKLGEKNE